MLARVCHGALVSHRVSSPTAVNGEMGAACWSRNHNVRSCRRLIRRISAQAKNSDKEANDPRHQIAFSIYHNVQEGDTLTSIAKQYGTSVNTIAIANNIKDVDIVLAGDILLVPVHPKVFQKVTALVMGLDGGKFSPINVDDKMAETSSISQPLVIETVEVARPHSRGGFWNIVNFAAPLVILAPIVVFLVRYFAQVACNEIKFQVSKTQAEKNAWDAQHQPKVRRWQGILDGDRETDESYPADVQLEEATVPETEEERKKREDEELRQSYVELEATYVKFLADSGLAKSGYWRGGMPSSNGDFG